MKRSPTGLSFPAFMTGGASHCLQTARCVIVGQTLTERHERVTSVDGQRHRNTSTGTGRTMTDDLTALRHMVEENARIAQETGVGSGSIAFEPQSVLALLDRLERAEAAIERIRAVHGQHPRWPDKCGGCDGYYPCPEYACAPVTCTQLRSLRMPKTSRCKATTKPGIGAFIRTSSETGRLNLLSRLARSVSGIEAEGTTRRRKRTLQQSRSETRFKQTTGRIGNEREWKGC